MYFLGQPKYIVVDDKLPIKDHGWMVTPYSTQRSENGAWWMPILEKGFAKYTQSYQALEAGKSLEGFRALTGMPVKLFDTTEMNAWDIYEKIKDADQNHYMMAAGCHNSVYGLVSSHAYSVLGVNTSTQRIIVRNPWASEKYTGPGSD